MIIIDHSTLTQRAKEIQNSNCEPSVENLDVSLLEYIEILKSAKIADSKIIKITLSKLERLKEGWIPSEEETEHITDLLSKAETVLFEINFPLQRKVEGALETKLVTFTCAVAIAKSSDHCIEVYHRDGMVIPKANPTRDPLLKKYLCVFLTSNNDLNDALNCFESKAHREWTSTAITREKMQHEFPDGDRILDLCRFSIRDIIKILEKTTKKESRQIWSDLLPKPKERGGRKGGDSKTNLVQGVVVNNLKDGFEVQSDARNPQKPGTTYVISCGYATEVANGISKYHKTDFDLLHDRLLSGNENCTPVHKNGNSVEITTLKENWAIRFEGFDHRGRGLDIQVDIKP